MQKIEKMGKGNLLKYILITPARNEEGNIEKTIRAIIHQTYLPQKWVIVSDSSIDQTDDIVRQYREKISWIELVRLPEYRERSFAAKVHCFNAGYALVKSGEFDILGNLDADVSFGKDYFEFLIDKFDKMPELGVAGTPFIENGYSSIDDSFEGERHVAGGVQLFRRRCFEDIGGYVPNKAGGIDWIAITTARMKGWKTQSFKEKTFFHYRSLGTAESNLVGSYFKYGKKDYYLGNHPLWEMFMVTYRLFKKPFLLGNGFAGWISLGFDNAENDN